MEQSAVEWLVDQLTSIGVLEIPQGSNAVTLIIEQAKEIEKQQIFESWDNGFDNGNYYGKYNENCEINCGEQYYNETFNNK